MSWALWISTYIGPWIKKALFALGIGVITYTGFAAVKGQIGSAIASMWGAVASSAYQILALAGFVDAMGVWLGALTTIAALAAFKRLGMLQA